MDELETKINVSSINTFDFIFSPPANELRASNRNPLKGVEVLLYGYFRALVHFHWTFDISPQCYSRAVQR